MSDLSALVLSSDADTDVWVVLTPGGDAAAWAAEEARLCFSETDEPYDDAQVEALAGQLRVVAQSLDPDVVDAAFVHLPAPAQGAGFVVTVQIAPSGDGSEQALLELALGDREGLSEANVEPFEGELGAGLRVQQHLEQDGTVLDTLTYVWHRPDLGADVRVGTASAFLGELLDAEDDVEGLVRGLDVSLPV